MKLRILGCGTSTGVPHATNGWGDCNPREPRNRRLRSALLVQSGERNLLVDCGPDLRQQLLAADCRRLDEVLVTHDHADHCHGIDDLRPFMHRNGAPLPLHGRSDTLRRLGEKFSYAFAQEGFYPPLVRAVPVGRDHCFGEVSMSFVDQPHGGITSLGIRMEDGARSAGYAIDYHDLTDQMALLYAGVDVWISDCLQRQPHPTHAHLDAVLYWARDLRVGQLVLTHLNASMDYRTLVNELPDWAAPAHDGMEIGLA